jgi:hypothetical protein
MAGNKQVIEVRTYSLRENSSETFAQVMAGKAVPMMTAAGLKVVFFGACVAEPNTYLLVRAFESLEIRHQQKSAFYGSREWKDGVEDEVMSCIDTYLTAVMEVTAEVAEALSWSRPASAG